MAIGDAYATPQEYRAERDGQSPDSDLLIARRLLAVSRLLDRKLNQASGFNRDEEPTTRPYDVTPPTPAEVDPIASLTGLEVRLAGADGLFSDPLAAGQFELLPLNAGTGPEPRPWRFIRFPQWTSLLELSPSTWTGTRRVQVTAIHGWPAVPEAIRWATIELTHILRGESIFATNRITEIDATVEAAPQARAVLKSLYEVYNYYPIAVA